MARILVVDDERNVREILRLELEQRGHTVVEAANGEQALERFRQNPADLVCLDIRMPGMSGLETLAELREIDLNVLIVILTALSEYKQDFSVWSADAYVVKSEGVSRVVDTVEQLLARAGHQLPAANKTPPGPHSGPSGESEPS